MSGPSQIDSATNPRSHLVQQLRGQLGRWEVDFGEPSRAALAHEGAVFSSGAEAIDRLLPGGGLRHGMLVEWLGGEGSSGGEQKSRSYFTTPLLHCSTAPLLHHCSSSAVTLSLLSGRESCRDGGELVVIDRRRIFYPPAAAAWGIDLARLIVIHPHTARDELWAAVESLRSPAVAAVWAAIDKLDHRAFRRLQLAAHAGRTLGLLLRPSSARGEPSWADVRLGIKTRQGDRKTRRQGDKPVQTFSLSGFARRVQVEVLRMRGGRAGGMVMLEIDDVIHNVREAEKNYQLSAFSHRPNLLANSRIADSRRPTAI